LKVKRMNEANICPVPTPDQSCAGKSNSIAALITAGQAALGYSDLELANALGYEKANVVLLMKRGSMRLPINKVYALASVLQLAPADVLRLSLAEHSPEMLAVIEKAFNPLELNKAERNLILHLRELAAGRDITPMVFHGGVVALVTT
jgi:hypothetical protein